MSNPLTKYKVINYDVEKLCRMSFEKFMWNVLKPDTEYGTNTIEQAWEKLNYEEILNRFNITPHDIQNAYYVIDLSQETFKENLQYIFIGLLLCCEKIATYQMEKLAATSETVPEKNFVLKIDGIDINLAFHKEFLSKVNHLMKFVGPFKTVNFNQFTDKEKNIIIISQKSFNIGLGNGRPCVHLLQKLDKYSTVKYYDEQIITMPCDIELIDKLNPTTLKRNLTVKRVTAKLIHHSRFSVEKILILFVLFFLFLKFLKYFI
jgi:hypothetical protein